MKPNPTPKFQRFRCWISRLFRLDHDPECQSCSVALCPYGEPFHLHHDGCPACVDKMGRVSCTYCHGAHLVPWEPTEYDSLSGGMECPRCGAPENWEDQIGIPH